MNKSFLGAMVIALGLSYFWLQGQRTLSEGPRATATFSPPDASPGAAAAFSPPDASVKRAVVGAGKSRLAGIFLPILQKLPKIEDGRKLTAADTHQIPPELLKKIAPLVKINHLVKENPDLEPAALEFYETCASETDLMNAVRARCLTHLRSLAKKRGETVDLSHYSARLIRLSEFINL